MGGTEIFGSYRNIGKKAKGATTGELDILIGSVKCLGGFKGGKKRKVRFLLRHKHGSEDKGSEGGKDIKGGFTLSFEYET